MIVNVVLDDDDTRLVEEIKTKKGNKNTAQIVRESIRCHHAFLFEQNYQYIDNGYKPSSRPTLTPEERAEPGIRLLKMPEIPRCVKTRAMWDAWIEGYRKDNLSWEVDGENKKWVIPDEPPKGMFEE